MQFFSSINQKNRLNGKDFSTYDFQYEKYSSYPQMFVKANVDSLGSNFSSLITILSNLLQVYTCCFTFTTTTKIKINIIVMQINTKILVYFLMVVIEIIGFITIVTNIVMQFDRVFLVCNLRQRGL